MGDCLGGTGGAGGYNSTVVQVQGNEAVWFDVAPCCQTDGSNTVVSSPALGVFMNVTGGTAGGDAGPDPENECREGVNGVGGAVIGCQDFFGFVMPDVMCPPSDDDGGCQWCVLAPGCGGNGHFTRYKGGPGYVVIDCTKQQQ